MIIDIKIGDLGGNYVQKIQEIRTQEGLQEMHSKIIEGWVKRYIEMAICRWARSQNFLEGGLLENVNENAKIWQRKHPNQQDQQTKQAKDLCDAIDRAESLEARQRAIDELMAFVETQLRKSAST